MTFRGSPYAQQSALYPVLVHLHRLLHWQRDDAPEERLTKLERVLTTYRFPQPDTVSLLAALLSLPSPAHYPPLTLTPQRQKQRTLDTLVAWLLEEAKRQPVLMVWEDLHWADPSSLELLGLCIDQVPTARLLLVLTCRPEFHPPWPPWPQLTHLTLNRFSRQHSAEMATRVAGGTALPATVLQQIVAQTDGVPLFVEEITKTVLESDLLQTREAHSALTGPLPPLAIPTTLHDALMARLDRLATVKVVAQLGATLGRTFTYELLQAVSSLDELVAWRSLVQLVKAEVLYQRGELPHATYTFKHALLQEAAYQSLLRSTRQQYHQRIAQVLAERFSDLAETQPELLAHHYTEAGLAEPAVGYWQRAGERCNAQFAYTEAISHVTTALALLETLPDTVERAQRELVLQVLLGDALGLTMGRAAPETGMAYARARELGQQVGEPPQLFAVLSGLHEFYVQQGQYQTAHELAEQYLSLAQRQRDPAGLVRSHWKMGQTLFWLGELSAARSYLEQAMALADSQRGPASIGACQFAAPVLWLLGYPEQAMERSHEMLTLARERAHPYILANSLFWAAWLHASRREGPLAQERAEASITLATEHALVAPLALGTLMRGWALAAQGHGEEGIAQLRQGMDAFRAAGSEVGRTHKLSLLAEAYGNVGQAAEGLNVLAEALAFAHTTGERPWEAELYRLKGELLLSLHPASPAAPEECFHQALEIARHQRAKSLELRAAMSLSRLWQRQGKRAEAHQLLAPIYGWFTEGFDTIDLQEAKALLEELA